MLNWKRISDEDYRAKVYGGWLIRSIVKIEDEGAYRNGRRVYNKHVTTTFVPDPEYKWEAMEILNHPHPVRF